MEEEEENRWGEELGIKPVIFLPAEVVHLTEGGPGRKKMAHPGGREATLARKVGNEKGQGRRGADPIKVTLDHSMTPLPSKRNE